MNRAIRILSAAGALSAATASVAHAAALRTAADRPDALLAAHASMAPQQGGKGHGGGGQHGGGGGQHARGHQDGGGGGHQARAHGGGGGHQAHGGGGHAARTAHANGRGHGSGERTVRASRSTRVVRADRVTGSERRVTRLVSGRSAGGREHASRLLTRAAALGRGHGLANDAVNVRDDNGRIRLLNRRGDILIDMDADRYGDIGAWRLRRMGDQRPRGNAPAFCRSGEGHPVWGRQWCLDKGFGLGSRAGTLWSRGTIDDVVFRRYDYATGTRLDRGSLLGVLGDVVLGRLALQALGLGYDQPLVGTWVAQPSSPRLLRVYAGPYPVAEFVDTNYDNRPEVLYVVQPLYP